jgi:hypothetical protein
VSTPEQLFDELVDCWTRGEPLGVDELLVRAGPQADELATLIDRFLERAPRREPTPAALAFVRSLDEPSLLRARQERKLKLDDLVAGLVEKLSLPERARAKVRRYYQDLELGQLDPAGVAAIVWVALSGLLGRDARGLAAMPPFASAAPAMYREADFDHNLLHATLAMPSLSADEPESDLDEVDRLFGVTSSD